MQVREVIGAVVDLFDRRRIARGNRPRRVGDDRFDVALDVSVNFSPAPENTLMPLSSNGLCDAEITTPAV